MALTSPHSAAPAPGERQFELLVNAVTDYAIFMLDRAGIVSTWNAGAQRIKGYAPDEIIGRPFSLFFTDEDRRRGLPENALQTAARTGRFESEGWRLRKDGSRFLASAVLEAIRDDAGLVIGYAKVTRDITERRAAYDALVESERRFRLLVDGVVDYAIYMLDPSGIVINWNTGAERIKGYKASEIIGQHFSRFYGKEDRAAGLPARALDIARREGKYESEGWRVRKDGSRFWASSVLDVIRDETGALSGFAKITRDITERRAAQEAQRESERQFRLLVSGVTDYSLFMLDPNGIVSTWNAGAQRTKGYRAEEIIGQHFSKFYTNADRSAGVPTRALQKAMQEGKYESEGWRLRKDGTAFWASVVIDAIRDENGALVGFAKITRDITERREAQLALQQTNEQLARAQKMEALGQLTGGVAHDFNNLLMIVSGHAQMIKKLVADQPKVMRAVEAIDLAATRGERLTRQLLSFARRQRLNPTAVDLPQQIAVFGDMLESLVSQNVRLITAIPPGIWPVELDASELELALVNVAVNSRDAMPDGGTITVTAENVQLKGDASHPDLDGDFVALTLADTGTGIPEDILPKIFDPFFTTKEIDKGTGLGLSQVYGFARQSGGAVAVKSEVGRGTQVTMYLPRALSEPARLADSREHDAAAAAGGAILLVEDNPDVANVSAALLEELGYRARIVSNADAALRVLEEGEQFDLVFSDIVMTGQMDGLALGRAVRERHPGVPVLLATGYSKAAEAAHHEFPILRKPYQIAELERVIGNLVAEGQHRTSETNLVRFRKVKKGRTPPPDQP